MTIGFSCLKTSVDVSWVGAYLCFCFFFFQLQKGEINDKGGDLCQAWRNVRGGGVRGSCDRLWWGVMVGGGSKKGNFSDVIIGRPLLMVIFAVLMSLPKENYVIRASSFPVNTNAGRRLGLREKCLYSEFFPHTDWIGCSNHFSIFRIWLHAICFYKTLSILILPSFI